MDYNKRIIAEIVDGENVIMTIDRNMLSCEFGALDRGNLTDVVNWGIYANRGSISFIDNIGFFNNQNVNSSEIKKYTVKFYLSKYEHQKILIATFKIDDVDFEEETRMVNVNLVSTLLALQQENTEATIYPFIATDSFDLVDMINDVLPNSRFYVGENFYNTTIGCPYIGKDTAWNVITKVCQATMSRVVETPNGDFEIKNSFPEKNPIIVKPNNILNLQKAEFVKVENPNIRVNKREVFLSKVLEGSISSFHIDWDIDEQNILDTSGITLSNIEKNTTEEEASFYAEGSIIVKTPYKIYAVYKDNTVYDTRTILQRIEEDFPFSDRNYTNKSSFFGTPYVENEQNIAANLNRREIYYKSQLTVNSSPYGYRQEFLSSGTVSFPVSTFVDSGNIHYYITKGLENDEEIESNDLIQTISTAPNGEELGSYIIEEVYKRYHKGIECFEIECLFNDYYYEDGSLAFTGQDLSNHFNKYDVVIPYVMRKGKTVPLRTNADGTPKKFRVIGISYSYDGLLKQKLSLHEERYDVD